MTKAVERGLQAITSRTNLSTGLAHPNDMNAAKEMFTLLHKAGEILLQAEIAPWARGHGWQSKDADELGALAQQIGMGKRVKIKDGPWWKDGIIEAFRSGSDGDD